MIRVLDKSVGRGLDSKAMLTNKGKQLNLHEAKATINNIGNCLGLIWRDRQTSQWENNYYLVNLPSIDYII